MKKQMLRFVLPFLFIPCFVSAQQAPSKPRNLNEISKKFYAEYERQVKAGLRQREDKKADGILKQFQRWEYLMRCRTYPSGNLPDAGSQWKAWNASLEKNPEMYAAQAALPLWSQVGASQVPSNGGGAGRINAARVDPSNSNIIWLATAGGGVWKTTDGGITWACLSDKFPVTSISDIAIDPTNSNNVYVATGDRSGYTFGSANDFWGGVYTSGVLRTTNGGTTWSSAFPNLSQSDRSMIQRLLINPSNKNILLGAALDGIYRTTNGGASITKVLNAYCHDMEWKPGDPNTVYAGGNGTIYRSTDAGATWVSIKTGVGSGRMSIEVSAANPSAVYALSEGSVFQYSGDGGTTWISKTYPFGASFYGYYDIAFGVSPDNANVLYAGGLNTVRSSNGGTSWSNVDNWSSFTAANYVHADKHGFAFIAGQPNTAFALTDGGIFKTTNNGTNWADLSNGLMIAQIYRLGTSPQNTNLYLSGWQDNGCNLWNGTSWRQVFGADGMEAAIDATNQNLMYECYQNGGLQRSTNGGTNWSYIAPSFGNWITPFVLDPVTANRLYYGSSSALYLSNNNGTSWSSIAGSSLGEYGSAITVAPSNNNIVYYASFGKILKCDVGAGTSVNITGTLPVNLTGINYIAVSNTDANKVWVCLGGYNAGNKVFSSTNGGTNWTNISGTLPNLPVNTIVYQNNTANDRVYVGTDVGTYYRDNTTNAWKAFNNGLPNVMVHELEINYTSNKLVAATYGRGIWQADLISPSPIGVATTTIVNNDMQNPALNFSVSPNPASNFVSVKVTGATDKISVGIYNIKDGKQLIYNSYANAQVKDIKIKVDQLKEGVYVMRVQSGTAVMSKELKIQH